MIDRADRVKKEAAHLRRIIRRNKGAVLTNSEIKVLVALVNLWLYHRNGPKGYIHPGRKLLAKKAGVSVVTVARSLEIFRILGIAKAIRNLKGGNGRATQYVVDTDAIKEIFDPCDVKTVAGELVPFSVSFPTQNDTQQPYQNDTLSIGILQDRPSQVSESFEGVDHE
jgi:hypothetical protein